jgi:hypothetical protein
VAVKRSAIALLAVLCASSLRAHDKWESGLHVDDTSAGAVALIHGVRQLHDLEGPAAGPDQDWFRYYGVPGHSYEVRITSATVRFNSASHGLSGPYADLDRMLDSTFVLTPGTGPNTEVYVRWTESQPVGHLRVKGSTNVNYGAGEQYEIEMVDTTCFGARFNNVGSQSTVLLAGNTSRDPLGGSITFYSAAGAVLFVEPMSIAPNGMKVFNTASAPALQGQSGSFAIAHDGPYGAVVGKAVALEPSTGFTFDTPIVPMPR